MIRNSSNGQHTEAGLVVLDRSTLEHWADCPAQAAFIAQGVADCAGLDAASGTEVHSAISYTIKTHCLTHGAMEANDIKECLLDAAKLSRPDVQPDVLNAVRPFAWEFAKFLKGIEPEYILAFDGGEGEQNSQLAWDFPELGCRVTSELDFLYAGASPERVKLVDWKSGHKKFTEEAVKESFQFGMHAWLVFKHWESVDCVDVSVWSPRLNTLTYSVPFKRSRMDELGQRVYSAAQNAMRYQKEAAPAWPAPEKCRLCPAVLSCLDAPPQTQQIISDPHKSIIWAHKAQKAIDEITATLRDGIEATGRDIITPEGFALGHQKPKKERRMPPTFYTLKQESE